MATGENGMSVMIGSVANILYCPCGSCGEAQNQVSVAQGYAGVVTRFGQFDRVIPAGRHRINIMCEEVTSVSLKVGFIDVPPQDVITADNLSLQIDAVVYFHVFDPYKAIFGVEQYRFAVGNQAQVMLRQALGENTLSEIMTQRSKVNDRLQELIDEATDPWGIKVTSCELKGVILDQMMQRAMAAKAESKQEAEAKVIQARAQRDVAGILAEASSAMVECPEALMLQYFETLRTIAVQGQPMNRTIIVPAGMDASAALAMQAA
jgi:regulator of protease activity HflC (stomatin/prohibitin superfamily)